MRFEQNLINETEKNAVSELIRELLEWFFNFHTCQQDNKVN